jgi:predicted secreted protein
MRIAVQADDGDEVSISADVISAEQALVTVTIENSLYSADGELESLTLTVEKARELAKALVSVADAVEFVNLPPEALNWTAEITRARDERTVL